MRRTTRRQEKVPKTGISLTSSHTICSTSRDPGFRPHTRTTMSLITSLVRHQRIALLSTAHRLVASRSWQSTATPAPAPTPSKGSDGLPFVSTGIHYGKYPHEDMLAIMRRASKVEDPKYERRRRIQLVKIIVAIGAFAVMYVSFWWLMILWAQFEDWKD